MINLVLAFRHFSILRAENVSIGSLSNLVLTFDTPGRKAWEDVFEIFSVFFAWWTLRVL